jgi:hypothetical protein
MPSLIHHSNSLIMEFYQSLLRPNLTACPPWIYMLASLLTLPVTSCGPVNSHPSTTAGKTQESGATTAIAFDYSGSVAGISHAGMPELVQLTDSLLASGKAVVVVFDAISSPSDLALVRLTLQPLIPTTNLPLAQRASIAARNRAVIEKNRRAALLFLQQCRKRIAWAIAMAEEEQTDLNGFLNKVAIFQQEPGVKDFRHCVFLQSDGDHDILIKRNGRRVRIRGLKCPDWADGVCLYVCNWKSAQTCGITQMFESTQGFLNYYFKQIKS